MSGPARHDLPEADDFTRPYWDAAAEGRLLLRRCAQCGRAHHYPREFCPHCWAGEDRVLWETASGRATLYTWSVVHRNDLPPFGARVPYTAAVVDLAEGPRMMTQVVDCPAPQLRIGMPLEVGFGQLADGVWIPVFRPASQGQSSSRTQEPLARRR
ncbi:nucleic acid-binding protein [Streptomyces sp. CB00455]|uniref:Zn-ribbon domain-containing OB-fold protein n=1 Tax=Streptomyces sp. CB00455 TaxID=1703927 RepID=UPI00093DE4B6|nr:Zn-ribbon domain-containing OB-fold protein [Streptomyces sp. CB00455]OKK16839.1 nucleic acid-binding protein [Streptomyces sp. CB00455]